MTLFISPLLMAIGITLTDPFHLQPHTDNNGSIRDSVIAAQLLQWMGYCVVTNMFVEQWSIVDDTWEPYWTPICYQSCPNSTDEP